jgi:hypothetical protein
LRAVCDTGQQPPRGEDPDRWLVLGPDRAANLLEVVVLSTVDGSQWAIHAMSMRPTYERLLRP